MKFRVGAVLAAFALVAAGARAGDARLELGFSADVNYDDNVFSRSVDEQDDFFVRLGPRLHLFDRRGDLQWSLDYLPSYRKYLDSSELDDWDHVASGNLSWVPSERTRAFVNASYADVSSFLFLAEVDPTLGDTGAELTTQRVERSVFGAGVEHRLTRRQALTLSAERLENDYELATRADVTVTRGGLSWLYDLTRRDRAGFDLRFTRQEFGIPDARETVTDYYNVSLQLLHVFDPTLFLTLSVGPALVDPEPADRDVMATVPRFPRIVGANGVAGQTLPATCPTLDDGTPFLSAACQTTPDLSALFPFLLESTTIGVVGSDPSTSGDDLTYFAAISLTKNWRSVRGQLDYTRNTSTAGEFGGSAVRDLVLGKLIWRTTRRLTTELQLSYESYEAATDRATLVIALRPFDPSLPVGEAFGLRTVLVPNERQEEIYRAVVRLRYRLTERTFCNMTVLWQRQMFDRPPLEAIETDRLLVTIGFTYTFRSIPLGI